MAQILYDTNTWFRTSRGKVLQFYALDEEVEVALSDALLSKYGPYIIAGSVMVKQDKRYIQEAFFCGLEEFRELRKKGLWKFFVLSKELTPDLKVAPGDDVSAILSLNGLVNLQQGLITKGKWCDSSIGVVNRVANSVTNEGLYHEGYVEIFNALKRRLKKILVYTTVSTWLTGERHESKSILMSEGFAEKCRRGEIIAWASPGRPLKKKKIGGIIS